MGGDLHEEENLGAGCARLPDENLEIRGADEIDDAIDRKLAPATVLEAVGAAAASSGAARPKAKGRAATKKVAKFVADDD